MPGRLHDPAATTSQLPEDFRAEAELRPRHKGCLKEEKEGGLYDITRRQRLEAEGRLSVGGMAETDRLPDDSIRQHDQQLHPACFSTRTQLTGKRGVPSLRL